MAVWYLTMDTENHVVLQLIRALLAFCSQQIRASLIVIVIERIIATIFLERYKLSSQLSLFWGLTIFTYLTSLLYWVLATLGNHLRKLSRYPRRLFLGGASSFNLHGQGF